MTLGEEYLLEICGFDGPFLGDLELELFPGSPVNNCQEAAKVPRRANDLLRGDGGGLEDRREITRGGGGGDRGGGYVGGKDGEPAVGESRRIEPPFHRLVREKRSDSEPRKKDGERGRGSSDPRKRIGRRKNSPSRLHENHSSPVGCKWIGSSSATRSIPNLILLGPRRNV